MKIKTRFTLGNMMMVLISLLVMLIIGTIIISIFNYNNHNTDNFTLNKNYTNILELLKSSDYDGSSEKLSNRLKIYGYEYYEIKDGKISFSSKDDDCKNKVLHIALAPNWNDNTKTMIVDGATIVAVKSDDVIKVAVNGVLKSEKGNNVPGENNSLSQNYLTLFIVIGFATIIIILIGSNIYSRWLIKRVMTPLEALAQGSMRIERGDLTHEIFYSGDDEFTLVINSFNRMQRHLIREHNKISFYEKSRTDMIAGISHDLRTPLTSIKGYIKGLSDGVATTPEKQKQYLDIAYKKSCDMEKLLQRLFYFSKLETGNMPFNFEKIDLAQFVTEFVEETSFELKNEGIELTQICQEGKHYILADIEQIFRIISNLIDNSKKYAEAENLKLEIKVWKENDEEHLSFRDNGKGVPEIMLDSIYDCFFRVDEARGFKNGEGSGLGLHIVKYIAQQHNAKCFSYNDNGLVTEFIFKSFDKENENEQDTDS